MYNQHVLEGLTMSTDASDCVNVATQRTTKIISIITPHVLRFRRPTLRQRPARVELYSPSESSDTPSRRPCLPAVGRTASVFSCAASCPSVASPWSTETAPSGSDDSDGGASACVSAAGGQHVSPPCLCRPDTAHLSMGCDVADAASAILQLRQSGVAPAELLSPLQGTAAQATLPVHHATTAGAPNTTPSRGVLPPCSASVPPCLVSPLLGCEVLSEADIPLQDEYVIENEDDGPVLPEALFPCTGENDSCHSAASRLTGDGGENDSCHSAASRLTGDGAEQHAEWNNASPQMMGSEPIYYADVSSDGYQLATPGCRCSLAESYNKRLLLGRHRDPADREPVHVQILPADPLSASLPSQLSPLEDRSVPESKASVAIQRLISSVVPPITADLIKPQLYLDADSVTTWSAATAAVPTVLVAAECQQPLLDPFGGAPEPIECDRRLGDADDPPPAASVGTLDSDAALFATRVGPPAEHPDSLLMPGDSVVFLTEGDVVEMGEIEVPVAAPERRARGGRVRGRRAGGGARRPADGGGDGDRASRGRRGRGRRGRGASSARDLGTAVFVSGGGHPDPWQAQTVAASASGGDSPRPAAIGDDPAERRPPCRHFRRVVVGLADLGPEPLAPTGKYQLWRRLSGTPEMLDLCHCLDLSYLVLHAADGGVSYRCNICRKEFALHSSVRRHHRMVHDDERRYTCAECGASYYQLSDLKRHLLASHTDLKPFVCRRCGEQFARSGDFRKHVNNHWS